MKRPLAVCKCLWRTGYYCSNTTINNLIIVCYIGWIEFLSKHGIMGYLSQLEELDFDRMNSMVCLCRM